MSLSEQLSDDMKQAMRDKDKFKLTVIRMIIASVKNAEIDKGNKLDDNAVQDIVNRELKQRKDSLQEFEKAGREDLVEQLRKEIEIITSYLPEQLSDEEVKSLVIQTIQDLGASSKAEMGKVMGALMPKVKGRADGKLVNRLVSENLQ